MDALVDGEADVVQDHVRVGEVDDHLRPTVGDAEQPVARVDRADQVHVLGRDHGLAHLLSHPSPGSQDAYPDRFAHHIASRPTQTAPAKSRVPNGPTTARHRG